MEYVTTGLKDDLDTRIHGFPRGELSIIKGESEIVQQMWVNEQVKYNDASVISTLRPSASLEQQLPDGAEYYSGDVSEALESISYTGNSLVIESNESLPLDELMRRVKEQDIAVILITTEPSEKELYTSSVILDVQHVQDLNQNLYNLYLIVQKHIYDEPSDTVLNLQYRPEPFVEKRKKA